MHRGWWGASRRDFLPCLFFHRFSPRFSLFLSRRIILLSSSGCVLVRSVNAVQHYSRLFGESLFNAFSRSFPASNCKTAWINNQGFFELSYPRLFDLIVPASYCCSLGFPSSLLQFSAFPWKIIHCSPSREIHFSVSCNRLEGYAAASSRDSYIETQHPGVEDPAAAFPAGAFLLHYARFIVSRTKADSPWRVLTLGSDCDEHLRFYEWINLIGRLLRGRSASNGKLPAFQPNYDPLVLAFLFFFFCCFF